MTTATLTIELRVSEELAPHLQNIDLFVIPHLPVEREALLRAMALVERFIEASRDAGAISAFQVVGEILARAQVIEKGGQA